MRTCPSIGFGRLAGLLAVLCVHCGVEEPGGANQAFGAGQDAPLAMFASIPPVAFLAEQIGGERVHADVLLQPGQEPHTFEPTPRQMAALTKSRLFLAVGTLPFEAALTARLSAGAGSLQVVNLSNGIALRDLAEHGHEGQEGHGDHHNEGADPHVWLGPRELLRMAGNAAKALSEALPEHAGEFERNLKAFEETVNAADERIRKALKPYEGETVFVFHPAFGYFTNTYGLGQMAVEIQGKSPRPKQIQMLIQEAKRHRARILFVQPQFDTKSADAVAQAIGGVLVPIDPLAKDVLKNFEDIAAKLEQALAEQERTPTAPAATEGETRHGG